MNQLRLLSLMFLAFCIVARGEAIAQSSAGSLGDEKPPLSQLIFDKHVGVDSSSARVSTLSHVLGRKAVTSPRARLKLPHRSAGVLRIRVPSQSTVFIKKHGRVAPAYALIPPRIKGPWADDDNSLTLTSRYRWGVKAEQLCDDIRDEATLRQKAWALREVIIRYSGSADAYDTLQDAVCVRECGEYKTPLISHVSVEDTVPIRLWSMKNGYGCRYQISRSKGVDWTTLQAEKVTCTCY